MTVIPQRKSEQDHGHRLQENRNQAAAGRGEDRFPQGERLARWLDAMEKRRTATVTVGKDGSERMVITAWTHNTYLQAIRGLCQWCVEMGWLDVNPLARIAMADETSRQGSAIPLRADFAEDLRHWLARKARATQDLLTVAPRIRPLPSLHQSMQHLPANRAHCSQSLTKQQAKPRKPGLPGLSP
jgi:hypothetical protein